ncbi:MAG: ATP-binding protein [Syntrophobacteraceae bacterium]|nr:ATP-binding protein [Syntrophobacteraceae bacterium]
MRETAGTKLELLAELNGLRERVSQLERERIEMGLAPRVRRKGGGIPDFAGAAEEAPGQSERKYRQLFEMQPDALLLIDAHTLHILDVNPAAVNLYGYSRGELLGLRSADIFAEQSCTFLRDSGPDTPCPGREAPGGQVSICRHRKKDGTLFPVEIAGKCFVLEGKQACLAAIREISGRKRLEQQRRQKVKAESLTRMAGAIAHLFNNQLAVLIGRLEMAMEDLGPDHIVATSLTESRKAALKASVISARMLEYLGQTSSALAAFDLMEACHRAIEAQVMSMPQTVTMEISIPSERLTIKGDRVKVEQVLTNLITNAKEAMGEGEGAIRVAVRVVPAKETPSPHLFPPGWQPESDLYACMEVSDSGCGIVPEQLDSIFDPFFSTKFTGRGLGLAVVQGTLRMHRGAVSVESAPGRGSVFRVFWPLEKREAASLPGQGPEIITPGELGGYVLVVDDEGAMRTMAAKMLGRLGCRVLTAADGLEAVETFKERKYEIRLVLLDLTMPGVSGRETLAGLRALVPGIPVILTSGYDEAAGLRGDHPESPQTFLHKPYGLKDLQKAIALALSTPVLNQGELAPVKGEG